MTLYYKMQQILLQNATALLLQNAAKVYYKMCQVILLQNAAALLLPNATKVYYKICQVFYNKMRRFYYKMRRLLQIATVHSIKLQKRSTKIFEKFCR